MHCIAFLYYNCIIILKTITKMYFILEDNPKEMYLIKERFNTLKEAQKRAKELTNPFCNYHIVKKESTY